MRWWSAGRALLLSIVAVTVTMSLLYLWWWVSIDGAWAPRDDPRYVQMHELLPILGGMVALYGVQPRLDWIDLQSPRPMSSFNTVAAGVVIVTFASLPLLAIWLWHFTDVYALFLPEGIGLTEKGVLPNFSYFIAFACNIITVLGLACLTTALVGRALGPLSAIVWFALLLLSQGHLGWHILPSVTIHHSLAEPSPISAAIATAALTLGLYAYHRSAAGTRGAFQGHGSTQTLSPDGAL